jgi:hypothetical protein
MEEIESLGNEQRHIVESHLCILLLHLLKWTYQTVRRRLSWRSSINDDRTEIEDRLLRSPSLRRERRHGAGWTEAAEIRAMDAKT